VWNYDRSNIVDSRDLNKIGCCLSDCSPSRLPMKTTV
jgi:hypothetical protein